MRTCSRLSLLNEANAVVVRVRDQDPARHGCHSPRNGQASAGRRAAVAAEARGTVSRHRHDDPGGRQCVDRIGELLSDKPRALKRFVNTYRLLKASLSELDQATFVTADASSPHKVCITQSRRSPVIRASRRGWSGSSSTRGPATCRA